MVVSIDYKKNFFGKQGVYIENGKTNTGLDPLLFAKQMEEAGAGELLLNSIERDGSFSGYDLEMIEKISHSVKYSIDCGGRRFCFVRFQKGRPAWCVCC